MDNFFKGANAQSPGFIHETPAFPLLKSGDPSKVERNKRPKILFITSYPPRECGIATYSQDLIHALSTQFQETFQFQVCEIQNRLTSMKPHSENRMKLIEDDPNSYRKNAFYINKDEDIQIVVIQHEFGFFNEKHLDFEEMCKLIKKPIVFVFHTVLPSPHESLKRQVQELVEIAASIVVMTLDAAQILVLDYQVPTTLISIIPHGTHLQPIQQNSKIREKLALSGKLILSTFGLLSSSKSIETTLNALPSVVKQYPDVLFLVLGKTHPNIIKQEGEAYRDSLMQTVNTLGLQPYVKFINRYLETGELLEYLQVSDIYLFTSKDRNQAVSGTFSYAISSGCAVVSTPIPHAKEVINGSNGIIFSFEDSMELAEAIKLLIEDEQLRMKISNNSLKAMASTSWQNSSIAHAQLFGRLLSANYSIHYSIPEINLKHVFNMTTNLGIVQFAKFSTPDLESGYTLDDNARALIATAHYYQITGDKRLLGLIYTYFNFIKFCFQSDGSFLNYVTKEGAFSTQNLDDNLEDSNGRAIWALGYVASLKGILPNELVLGAGNMMNEAIPLFAGVYSPRAIAFAIKGLYEQNSEVTLNWINHLGERLYRMYQTNKSTNWLWFEDYLTYGNSLLPEALLLAYTRTGRIEYRHAAKESFHFLLGKIFVNDQLKVVSNRGWMLKNQVQTTFSGGEQPIDVAYTIIALNKFFLAFDLDEYKKKMINAFNWFLGANHLNQIVYNPVTGGCYDGVEEKNVNLNQGAESTVSYLLARLTLST